jgi:hypothetical protein
MNRLTITLLMAVWLSGASGRASAEQVDPAIAAANASKAQADAETAAWNAETAKHNAESAAAKSNFGALADYTNSGTTTAGAKAGTLEASLLSADATRTAGTAIVDQLLVKHFLTNEGSSAVPVVVATEAEKLVFDAYDAFQAQAKELGNELDDAIATKPQPKGKPKVVRISTSAGAMTALSVVGNLFRSEYNVSAVDLTPSDLLLVKATMLAASAAQIKNAFYAPSLYSPPADTQANPAYLAMAGLRSRQLIASSQLDTYKAASAKDKNADYSVAIAKLEAALKRYADFAIKVSTADDKGNVLLGQIARQAHTAEILRHGGQLLILKADSTGGTAYTKKNFWTFLGELPFSVTAGTVVSYLMLSGADGRILDSGVFTQAEPYMKVKAISRRYAQGNAEGK